MSLMRDKTVEAASIPVPEAGCWIWGGCLHRGNGYGQLRTEGRRTVYAHRWAYEKMVGPIPVGLMVCHKCDTPACVNPDHLFLGDMSINIRDMHSKMRGGTEKVSPEQLSEALELRKSGWKLREIAAKYGVAISSIGLRLRKALRAEQLRGLQEWVSEQKRLNP